MASFADPSARAETRAQCQKLFRTVAPPLRLCYINKMVAVARRSSDLAGFDIALQAFRPQNPMSPLCLPSHTSAGAVDRPRPAAWLAEDVNQSSLTRIGIKATGGGTHQSKTMMLADLATLLASSGTNPRTLVIDENTLGKPSLNARKAALRRLIELYGIGGKLPIWQVLEELWQRDVPGRPMLALLSALARDPTLRDAAAAVLDVPVGAHVQAASLAAAFEARHPGRFGPGMAASLSRNAASSWTRARFLAGFSPKRRVHPTATPFTAAYAALLAGLCGFSGARLLSSRWLDVLDEPLENRLGLLRQAEGVGLARVRSVGDVLEIETLRPMAETLGVPDLVSH